MEPAVCKRLAFSESDAFRDGGNGGGEAKGEGAVECAIPQNFSAIRTPGSAEEADAEERKCPRSESAQLLASGGNGRLFGIANSRPPPNSSVSGSRLGSKFPDHTQFLRGPSKNENACLKSSEKIFREDIIVMDIWDESVDNSTVTMPNEGFTGEHPYPDEYDGDHSDDPLQGLPDALRRYDKFHYSIHGYLTLVIIIVGTVGNIVTVAVLTRKSMMSSINLILAALAVADMSVLITYLVKVRFHSDLPFMSYTEVTYPLAVFSMYFSHCFILSHTVSVWLTVVAAMWRVMAVCYPATTIQWRTLFRAKVAIACTCLACSLVCIPEFLKMKVEAITEEDGSSGYTHVDSDIYLRHQNFFDIYDNWVFNWLLYLLPCLPLTVFTVALVRNIYKVKRQERQENDHLTGNDSAEKRLTAVLVFILVVFLVVRIPPGIMYTLEFALESSFIHQVHFAFSGTINAMILFNSSVNFFIYFCLSSRFRDVAGEVFCSRLTGKLRSSKHRKLESEMELSRY